MTLAVIWYREKFGQLWCAADSRITGNAGVLTDSGPKIFPVPVVCHEQVKGPQYRVYKRHSFGFAYAGSTLSAMSTHSIVTACTQNLAKGHKSHHAVSLLSIVELYKSVGERQVIEMSSRLGVNDNLSSFCFDSFVFGFCPRENRFMAFVIVSSFAGGSFHMNVGQFETVPGQFLPIGSGEARFVELMKELEHLPDAGVLSTLKEMVRREERQDVGGHLQIGYVTKKGFQISPILDTSRGPNKAFVSFLGMDVTSDIQIDGFTIGYSAIRP